MWMCVSISTIQEFGHYIEQLDAMSQNRIELAWSKIKACLRKEKARDPQALTVAICKALDSITPDDVKG